MTEEQKLEHVLDRIEPALRKVSKVLEGEPMMTCMMVAFTAATRAGRIMGLPMLEAQSIFVKVWNSLPDDAL